MENGYVFVANSDSLEEGEPLDLVIEGEILVFTRVEGKVYAVDGICTHSYAELIEGGVDGYHLHCPLHFACFDMRNGSVVEGPTEVPLKTYDVQELDGGIWVKFNR